MGLFCLSAYSFRLKQRRKAEKVSVLTPLRGFWASENQQSLGRQKYAAFSLSRTHFGIGVTNVYLHAMAQLPHPSYSSPFFMAERDPRGDGGKGWDTCREISVNEGDSASTERHSGCRKLLISWDKVEIHIILTISHSLLNWHNQMSIYTLRYN